MLNHLKPVESFWITRNVSMYDIINSYTRINRSSSRRLNPDIGPDIITSLGGVDTRDDNNRVWWWWRYQGVGLWVYTILWVLTRVTGNDTCVVADCARRRTLEHDFIARSRVRLIVVRECHAVNSSPGQHEHNIKYAIIITNVELLFLRNISKLGTDRVKTCYVYVVRMQNTYLCNKIR